MLQLILENKPVLVGLHLGFAIVGIDLLLWHLGELVAGVRSNRRMKWVALGTVISFALSWLFGGYYYVRYYGNLVKPVIKAGAAPWAHDVIMESKEHIFLFILPLALTILFLSLLSGDELKDSGLKRPLMMLVGLTAGLALLIGLMGFIISSAARWG